MNWPFLECAPKRRVAPFAVLAAAFAFAGCNQGQSAVSGLVKPVAAATGFATTVPDAQDFVKASRPKDMDYLAVGITPPARKEKVLTPDELAAAEKDLESTRVNHDKLSGRPPPPPPKKKAGDTAKDDATKKQGEKIAPSL
jgi:hypothetical protein